jgi:hypothetical protein
MPPREGPLAKHRREITPQKRSGLVYELNTKTGQPRKTTPVFRTPGSPQVGVDLQPPGAKVQVPPDRRDRPAIMAVACRVLTDRADQPPAPQRDLHDHPVILELNITNPYPVE